MFEENGVSYEAIAMNTVNIQSFKCRLKKLYLMKLAVNISNSSGVTVSAYIRFSIFTVVQLLFSRDYEDYVSRNKS